MTSNRNEREEWKSRIKVICLKSSQMEVSALWQVLSELFYVVTVKAAQRRFFSELQLLRPRVSIFISWFVEMFRTEPQKQADVKCWFSYGSVLPTENPEAVSRTCCLLSRIPRSSSSNTTDKLSSSSIFTHSISGLVSSLFKHHGLEDLNIQRFYFYFF